MKEVWTARRAASCTGSSTPLALSLSRWPASTWVPSFSRCNTCTCLSMSTATSRSARPSYSSIRAPIRTALTPSPAPRPQPENVMLDVRGYVKVCDLGFAKRVVDRTYTKCGTPDYVAPEMLKGQGVNQAADWWALGVLAFEILTGETPLPRRARMLRWRLSRRSCAEPLSTRLGSCKQTRSTSSRACCRCTN